MKFYNQMRLSVAAMAAVLLGGFWGCSSANAQVAISMTYPTVATPCDSLTVTTRVVNTGGTLSQLMVSTILPGGTSYQYVNNSLVINASNAGTFTDQSLMTMTGGTNLLFDLSHLQFTNGPSSLLISEVFPGGTNVSQQWFELYNPTPMPISLDGWMIRDARPGISEPLPAVTLYSGQFLVLAADPSRFLAAHPGFTGALTGFPDNFNGNGLNRFADGLFLINSSAVTVDKISWGFDTSGLNPSVPYITTNTASLERAPANVDTGTAADWIQQNTPNPGTGSVQSGLGNGTTIDIIYQLTAQCGGLGGYFNTTATYQQPPGSATLTNTSVNFIAFATPVLLVGKTPQIQTAGNGDLVVWRLQVQNSGFGVARNAVLFDSIDPGLTFVGFSVNPVATNSTGTNVVVSWDASVIPALAGLTNGSAPISITVTALVATCQGDLNNRGDALFGCNPGDPCQDTRLNSSGARAAIEFQNNRPYLDFSLTPANPIAVSYCGGIDITLSVTNRNYTNGANAYSIGVQPNLVPGYNLVPYGSYATNSSGALVLASYLAKGACTNIVLHLQPGGVCPINTNLASQLITPFYTDICANTFASPVLPLTTYITGVSAAAVTETFNPVSLVAGTTTNVTVTADLVYANMGSVGIAQTLVQTYPATAGWGTPTNISSGGVLDTNAHKITWSTNVIGSGMAVFTFDIPVTKDISCAGSTTDSFPLQPQLYYDCLGCPGTVDTNSLLVSITTYGCICTNCGGGTNCAFVAALNSPKPLVETCEPQPFSMEISNFSGSYPNRWTNVAWTATLSGSFTNNSRAVEVAINGTNVSSYVSVIQSGSTLRVLFDGLNTNSDYGSVVAVTNLQISWDAAVSQPGSVSQDVQFNLCSANARFSSWVVGTSAMKVALTPPFLGYECGILKIPISLSQIPSPDSPLAATHGLFPDYDVDVILNLDPNNDPGSLGVGAPNPSLTYLANSSAFVGIISNAAGNPLILTNEPTVTNNLVIWHLGNLAVFTNGTINSQFQMKCGGAAIQHIQAFLRYNNRCEQGTLPQVLTNQSPVQLVSDQASALQENVSPSQISLTTTNFNFLVQLNNSGAAPAHNFFVEVHVPANIILTGATVPWNYVYALNAGTNAYHWNFTNNAAPLQGLIDDNGDGSFNDLAYQGTLSLVVTGAVVTCGNHQINTIAGSGCLGAVCQSVGPLPVNLQTIPGQAVAMLIFPKTLPICQSNSLSYDIRNAGLSSIYHITPSFYLPAGLTYVAGSAVATNVLTGQHLSIPDPSGAGTLASPYYWTEAQVAYLAELTSANDVVIGFQVQVACDATVNGQGGASCAYFDTCGTYNMTRWELSAANIGLPVLSITKSFWDLAGHPKTESIPGETNVFRITIQHTAQSAATVSGLGLTDYFPTGSFAFLGASIAPDATNGNQLVWGNATLMAAIPKQSGGPFAVTSAPISLVITGLTLNNCSSPVINSATVNYGCANSTCRSASASASVVMTAKLQFSPPGGNLQLNACGGTYTVTVQNNGAPATGLTWWNYAPAGYLIAAATVSGSLSNAPGQTATLYIPEQGQFAYLDLSNTNYTNVRGGDSYASGIPGNLYLGPGQSFTVTYFLVPDGSTLDCTMNAYPPAPVPVAVTNTVAYKNMCGNPGQIINTYYGLPDQPKPMVTLAPKSIIVTNGQVQNFTVTIKNNATHGNAGDLQARVLLAGGWTNVVILGVTNNTAGGSTNTGSFPITAETNAQNGVLVNLNSVILEPLETVTVGVQAVASQVPLPNSLGVTAEVVGQCGITSEYACASFSPTNPVATTMAPSPGISQISITNNPIYGFYQDYANGVGFSLAKTVRYSGEAPAAAGTNRIARIGENLVYRLTAEFFDAPFTNIVVNDSLPPNLVFGAPVDAGSSVNVTNWSFNAASGNFTLPAIVSSNATFTVDLPVTVTNGILNQAGVAFTNTASSSFQTVVTNQPAPVTTVVAEIEPVLNVGTLVSTNNLSFAPTVAGVQAGQILYYQIVITNDQGANGYDLWLSNSLPAGFTAPTVVSVVTTGGVYTNGVAAAGTLSPGLLNFAGGTLNVGTNLVDLNTNSSLVIVISAQPGYVVEPNQTLTNNTTIRWTSMPGLSAQERTGGSLSPAPGVNASTNDSILNNYAAASAATVFTVQAPVFAKALLGTEVVGAGNSASQAAIGELVTYTLTVTVPQGVTPNVQVTDSLHPGMAFVDVTNVAYSSGVSAANPPGTGTNPANVVIGNTNTGAGNRIAFNLGNVTDLDNNPATPDTITIYFRAVVLDQNTIPALGNGNQAGTVLTNGAVFTDSAGDTLTAASGSVTVVEPTLNVSEQISTSPGSGYGASIGPVQAGDPVYLSIVVTNNTTVTATTAYDLLLTNALPAGLTGASIYSVINAGPGNLYTNGVLATGPLAASLFAVGGNTVSQGTNQFNLEPGASLVLVVAANVAYSVNANTSFTDFATIAWSSLSGAQTNRSAYNSAANERTGSSGVPAVGINNSATDTILDNYAASSATVNTTVAAPTFAKIETTELSTTNNNAANQAAIGELVTYTLTLNVPQGITRGVTVVDTMDPGLAFAEVTSITAGSGVLSANNLEGKTTPITASTANVTFGNNSTGTGNQLTLNFGDITDNNSASGTPDTITVVCKAVVLDIAGNVKNTTLNNNARFTYSDGPALDAIQQTVTVVEPTLTVTKSVSTDNSTYSTSVTGQDYGNPIYYKLVIANGNTATDTTAYDLSLTDTFGSFFTPDAASPVFSATTNSSGGAIYVYNSGTPKQLDTTDFTVSGGILSLTSGRQIHLEPNATLTLVIKGSLAIGVNPSSTYNNTASIQWTSLPGTSTNRSLLNSSAHERNGTGGVDNYTASSSAVSVGITLPQFTKTLVSTEFSGGANATIGELVTYQLAVTVPEGTTPAASIVDTMDPGLAFVQVLSVTLPPNVTTANNIGTGTGPGAGVGPANVTVANNGTGTANKLTFNLGNVVNANTDNVARQVLIQVQAVVLDITAATSPYGNQAAVVLNNNASFSYTSGTTINSGPVAVTLVEPTLTVAKTVATSLGGTYGATASGLDAGNRVYYKITIANGSAVSDRTAYNLFLQDILDSTAYASPQIENVSITGVATYLVNGVAQTPDKADFAFAGTGNLTLGVVSGRRIALVPNSTLTITLSAQLITGVVPNQSVANLSTIRWASVDQDLKTRSIHNASSNSRDGASLVPAAGVNDATADQTILDNYAASSTSTTFTSQLPIVSKIVVATSESHTADNLILADFNNTSFTTLSGNWATAGNVAPQSQFIRIGGTATGTGGSGTLTFGTPQNLQPYNSLGVVVRAGAANLNTTMRLTLTDSDGTTARFDATLTGLTAGAVGFSYFVSVVFTAPSVAPSGGNGVLNLNAITSIAVAGSAASAVAWDIDKVYALRTLAVPGEIVRYRITAQVPQGTSPDMIIKDTLPAGMKFINDYTARIAFVSTSGSAVTASANGLASPKDVPGISGGGVQGSGDTVSSISLAVTGGSGVALADKNITSVPNNITDTYNSGSAVYFRLGNVVNTASDAAAEYIVIEFNALVLNDTDASTVNGSPNQAGVVLANTSGYYLNGNNANTLVGSASTANDFNNVVIVEPQINNLSKFINGAAPQDAGDVFTYRLQYCNDVKPSEQSAPVVDAATTADLGATFNAGQFTGAPTTVDGVTLGVGSRVLVKNQTLPAQNGIYRVTSAGTWDRASDFNSSANITLGYRTYVNAGTANGGLTFAQKTTGAITVNTTGITFASVARNSSVKVATTANIANLGNVNLNTGFDGVANLSLGDRVLVKNQTTASQNGIYYVTTAGASGVLTRATDMDQTAEAIQGFQVYVTSGNINSSKVFALASAVVTLGTTSQTWNPVDQVTAYNIVLTDVMPASAQFQSLTITSPDTGGAQTITMSGSFTGGSATVPAVGSSGTIIVTLNKLDPEAKISGATKDVTVDVSAKLADASQAGSLIPNTATLKYCTLPGGTGTASNPTGSTTPGSSGAANGARDGSNIASPTDNTPYNFQALTALNNYAAGATLNLTASKTLALVKNLAATSLTIAGGTTGNDLAIGEKATYQLTTTVEEGTTADVTLTDTVPTGLQYTNFTAYFRSAAGVTAIGKYSGVTYTDGTAIDARDIANGTTGTSGGGTLVFSLVTVVAPGTSSPGTKAFVVEYQLLAMNISQNTTGVTRQNSAVAASTGLGITTAASTTTATIKEPLLGLTKTLVTAGVDAGDTVVYDVVINNTGTATAYDLVVTDTLDSNLQLPLPYSAAVALHGTPPAYLASVDTSGNTAGAVNALLSELRVGDSVTLRITAQVKSLAAAKQTIANTATLTYTSLPGVDANERTGTGVGPNSYHTSAGSANFTLAQPSIDKQFMNGGTNGDFTSVASSSGTNVVIGEKVTYDILVTLPEGVTKALQVLDSLPTGLRFDSYEIVTSPGTAAHQSTLLTQSFNGTVPSLSSPPAVQAGPATLTFNFGDTTTVADNLGANNSFVIRVVATVQNVAANLANVTRANTASLTFTDPNNSATVPIADVNPANDPIVKIAEPALALTKTVPATPFDAGDLVTYTLTIANTSQQMAYDLSLADTLPGLITGGTVLGGTDFVATNFYVSTVRAASTNDLGAIFSVGSFTGAPASVDGITLADNDRILVKNQSSPAQNGIYVATSAAGGTWIRVADFSTAAQVTNGYLVSVLSGLWNTNALYQQTNIVTTVNTDPIQWRYYGTNTLPQVTDFAVVAGVVQVSSSSTVNLPPGASLTLKVAGTMAAAYEPGQTMTNTAGIQWTSTPGANADERTGTGSPAFNNYTNSATAITTAATPVLSKAIIDTDESGVTGSSGINGTNATIGEIITYRVTVSLPEGTTPNLVVTDNLPAGVALVTNSLAYITSRPADANSSHPGTGTAAFDGTLPGLPAVSPATPTNGLISFTFGTITVNGDNDTNDNTFAFTYQAVVLDLATNTGLLGAQRFWTNGITWTAGVTNGSGLIDPAGNIVAVVEPRLLFTQAIVVNGVPGNLNGDLNSPITLTLNVTGAANSLSTAFNTTFADTLPSQIGHSAFAPLTMADIIITNSAGTDISSAFTLVGGVLQTTNHSALGVATNGGFTVVISGVLNSATVPGQIYTNPAALGWSTRNGDFTTASGFDVNPYLTSDHERLYGLTNATTLNVNVYSIAGYVYADTNNDGIKQSDETGLNGVTVTLTGTDMIGRAVNLATYTAGDGAYNFGTLVPGNYVLTRTTTPGGYLDGKETVGTVFGGRVNNASFVDSTNITDIVIPSGGSAGGINYSFGLIPPASVAGQVLLDTNGNGIQDSGETTGITGVTITLLANGVTPVSTNITDSSGNYSFTNLPPGSYSIVQSVPAGYINTTATNLSVTLTTGEHQSGKNFLDALLVTIGNLVFQDVNNDGILDGPDTGINGVIVQLWNVNGLVASTNTASVGGVDGTYSFSVPAGSYYVKIPAPPATYPLNSGTTLTGNNQNNGHQPGGAGTAVTNAYITLTPGQVNNTQDIGLVPVTSLVAIGNFVFLDAAGNGTFTNGDFPAASVTMELYTNLQTAEVSPPLATVVTDTNGYYYFDNLLPGTYFVHVAAHEFQLGGHLYGSQPSFGTYTGDNQNHGIYNSDPDDNGISSAPVTLAVGSMPTGEGSTNYTGLVPDANNNFTIDFSFVPATNQVLIGDTVFFDANNNGRQDAGEPGINGVGVQLWQVGTGPGGTDKLDETQVTTNLGGLAGQYQFVEPPGTYYVVIAATNFLPGGPLARLPMSSSVVDLTSDNYNIGYQPGGLGTAAFSATNITLTSGQDNFVQDFGFTAPVTIGNYVWVDANGNGLKDGGETNLPGVRVVLYQTNSVLGVLTAVATNTTAADGSYLFTNQPPGTNAYVVGFNLPPGYVYTLPNVGSGTSATNYNSAVVAVTGITNGLTAGFVLISGQSNMTANAGAYLLVSLAGLVRLDVNGNGMTDLEDTNFVAGAIINVYDTNGVLIATKTTDSSGAYSVTNLAPGYYRIVQTPPAGYTNTTPAVLTVALASGQNSTGNNYLDTRPGMLAGLVFADVNRDGIMNGADYPITNVTMIVTGTNGLGQWVSNVVATLADGTYVFTNLLPGTNYTITEIQPAGYGQGTNAVGSLGGTNSAPDVISGIALTQNQSGTGYSFGEMVASLGSYVWNDANGDTVRQTAERGMAGVRVYLDLNHNGRYDTGEPTAITAADGSYLITNLLAGSYDVLITNLPAGAAETYDRDGLSTTNKVVGLVLLAGTNRTDANFGYRYVSSTLADYQAGAFHGYAVNRGIELQWNTLSEADIVDFVINRKNAQGQWELVAYVVASNSVSGAAYGVVDATATAPGSYEYQLVEEDMDGTSYNLDYCKVVVGSPVIVTIEMEPDGIRVRWTGGAAPYHLEKTTAQMSAALVARTAPVGNKAAAAVDSSVGWVEVPLPDQSTNTILLPQEAAHSFFRVRSGP
ncbi:MAG: SdrD B-like domain-containing protein [Verrucomicrobiota bacterium]